MAAVVALRGSIPASGDILTSDAVAARRTAEAFGFAATHEHALRDFDAGCWSGKRVTDIAPEDLAVWRSEPGHAVHGGESLAALIARVETFLAARLGGGNVVAFTHAAVLRAAVLATLGAPASAFWLIDMAPLTSLALTSDGRRWALRGLAPPAARPSAV